MKKSGFARKPLQLVSLALLSTTPLASAAAAVTAWGDNTYNQTNVPPDLTNVVALAAGNSQSLALRQDGTVATWGGNLDALTNAPASLSNVVQVAGGGTHSLALRADGTVVGWGANYYPDTNSPTGQATPPPDLANATGIAAGWAHSVALRYDRTVIAWGYNGSGQTNVPANMGPAIAVAAGDWFSAALREDGTVNVWGDNSAGQGNVPASLSNVIAIAARGSTMLALKGDGRVVAWGDGSVGQTNVPADLTNAVGIAAGGGFALALRDDGSVAAWGDNGAGHIDSAAGLAQVVAIAAGGAHGVALLGDGSPQLTLQPRNQSVFPGGSATFVAKAVGDSPLSYQWFKDGLALTDTTNLSGGTTPTFTLTNITSADTGGYSLVITNASGSVTSTVASMTILTSTVADALDPGANGTVYALAVQPDGKILVGGGFSSLGGQARKCLGRLNADGTLDASFNPGPNSTVYCLALQADGKVLVGGNFGTIGGQAHSRIARLNPDGNLDSSFNPSASNDVFSMALQADGRILLCGYFTVLNGQTRNRLGRLHPDGSLDISFDPGANNHPYSLAVQPDGKILVGGTFTTLGGQTRNYVGRLNTDGSLDTTFNPGAGNPVYSLAVQADGKILAGGLFTKLAGQGRGRIGRLNADGSLDPVFNPGAGGDVYSLAVQADSKVLVGGRFTTLGGQPCSRIGRLNADGSLDPTFNPGAGDPVHSLAVQDDGKVLAGGAFTTLGGQTRNRIGRLTNTEAAMESLGFDDSTVTWMRCGTGPELWRTTFDAGTNGMDWMSLGAGKRILGGWQERGLVLPTNATIRARGFCVGGEYNGSCWVVESFAGAPVIIRQPASVANVTNAMIGFSVAAGGTAPLLYQWYRNGAAILEATNAMFSIPSATTNDAGSYQVVVSNVFGAATSAVAVLRILDPPLPDSFDPGANDRIYAVSPQPDGKLIVGGWFTTLGGQARNYIGRLDRDGTLDPTFDPGASYAVYALAAQDDGKIVVGGLFTNLAGQARYYLGRLNPDGILDDSFNPGANGIVETLVVQPDGKIVVGGWFTTLAGQSRSCIGRLNADGTVDPDFDPGANDYVFSLALQPDGKILLGGNFSKLGGTTRNCIARLNADGSLDTGFNPTASLNVNSLAVQADGRILVGGSFTTLGGQARSCIGRLNSDGTVDLSFNPGANSRVWSMAIQADDSIVVSGTFNGLGGQTRTRIGRLYPDGTLDPFFNPGATESTYYGVGLVALQADGKVLVGGQFSMLGGQARTNIGRLNNTEPATESLSIEGSTVTWLRGGTAPGAWRTSFSATTNGVDWLSLGAATRIPGGWQLAGVSPPTSATLRGRAYIAAGYDNDSSWYVETGLGPAAISLQPASRTNNAGTIAQFVTVGAGTAPFGYQWRKGGMPVSDGGNVSGAQTSTLTLTNVLKADEGEYSVVITNASGSVTSRVATLTVIDPCVSTQPASVTTNAGATVLFSATPAGTETLSYQWRRNGMNVPGATAASLTLTNVQWADAGSFDLVVSSTFGAVTSAVATLSVNGPVILVDDGNFGLGTNGFGFAVGCMPGQAVVIEASTNLVDWVAIQTNLVTSEGIFVFIDQDTGGFPRRYYRVRLYDGELPAPAIDLGPGAGGLSTNGFSFNLHGVTGQTVVVEASTNLTTWNALATNTLGTGPLYFSEPAATNFACRYYRARAQ